MGTENGAGRRDCTHSHSDRPLQRHDTGSGSKGRKRERGRERESKRGASMARQDSERWRDDTKTSPSVERSSALWTTATSSSQQAASASIHQTTTSHGPTTSSSSSNNRSAVCCLSTGRVVTATTRGSQNWIPVSSFNSVVPQTS